MLGITHPMRATICSTMCLLNVIITKSFCRKEKSSYRKAWSRGEAQTMGDTSCSFPSSSYPAFPPLLFIFQHSPQKQAGERKAARFLPLFPHGLHFLQCFCSLLLPILILPKLPFPQAQGHFTPSTTSERKNSQRNSQPLTQTRGLPDHRREK